MYERKIGYSATAFWLKLSEMFERRNFPILADEAILRLLKKKEAELEFLQDPKNLSLKTAMNTNSSFQFQNDLSSDDSMQMLDPELKLLQKQETLKTEIQSINDYYSKFEDRIYKELSDPTNGYWFCSQPRNYERIEMSEVTSPRADYP